MSESSKASGGIGFVGVLTVVFIVLKLVGVINWSWVWVLSPIWISALIACLWVVLFVGFVAWLKK